VLANDRGGNGTLTANLIDAPYWGTVELAADGSFTYTTDSRYPPLPGDKDSFTYQVTDGVSFSKVVPVRLKFVQTSSYAAKSADAASAVTMANAQAQAKSQTILLQVDGALNTAQAKNRANYDVTVNGEDVAVRNVGYNPSTRKLLLQLAPQSLRAGDIVHLTWEDLKDAAGRDVSAGSVTVNAQ
jgi:hypothetical protein